MIIIIALVLEMILLLCVFLFVWGLAFYGIGILIKEIMITLNLWESLVDGVLAIKEYVAGIYKSIGEWVMKCLHLPS